MQIKIKKLRDNAVLPVRKTDGAIGFDLAVACDVCIEKMRQVIPLGFAMELPQGIEAKIEPRSGFSANGIEGFALFKPEVDKRQACVFPQQSVEDGPLYSRIDVAERFNADVLVGKIDPDYRGECGVIILNNEPNKQFLIKAGTRIAQMTFYHIADVDGFQLTEELTETKRGAGGFGHTGT